VRLIVREAAILGLLYFTYFVKPPSQQVIQQRLCQAWLMWCQTIVTFPAAEHCHRHSFPILQRVGDLSCW